MADAEITRTDTTQRKVGSCPACSENLWADVTTVTSAREPYWAEGRPRANAVTDIVAMSAAHACDSRSEDA